MRFQPANISACRHLLTVGAEEAFELGHQAHQVKLLQEGFVLHSGVQLHDEAAGQGRQLVEKKKQNTHETASTGVFFGQFDVLSLKMGVFVHVSNS